MLESTKKRYPMSRKKEKLQQDGRTGEINYKAEPNTYQRFLEGTNKTMCTPGPRKCNNDPHQGLNWTCLSV